MNPVRSGGDADLSGETRPRAHRELRFVVLATLILAAGFGVIAWRPVNDAAIEPLTGGIARVSGAILNLLGQEVTLDGTLLRNTRRALNVRNGCNGVEAMIVFLAAVLAFPAPWRSRAAGLAVGIVVVQAVNLVRVVTLFLIAVYFPARFETAHTVVWQSLVVLAGVLAWLHWVSRLPEPAAA